MADKPPLPSWIKLSRLPPNEAYTWFRNRKIVPSFRWKDVWNEQHAAAQTVAGMMSEDLLQKVFDALGKAIEDGRDAAWFEKQLTPTLIKGGWWGSREITDPITGEVRTANLGSPSRLRLIYETNVRTAEAAGRWEQARRVQGTQGFMMRRTMDDDRVRKVHAQWNYVVLPLDHPWWKDHAAPCDYGCRCKDVAVSEETIKEYIAAGLPIKRTAPRAEYREFERNGERIKVPVGIGPGFAWNPGDPDARKRALESLAKSKQDALAPPIRRASHARKKRPPQ